MNAKPDCASFDRRLPFGDHCLINPSSPACTKTTHHASTETYRASLTVASAVPSQFHFTEVTAPLQAQNEKRRLRADDAYVCASTDFSTLPVLLTNRNVPEPRCLRGGCAKTTAKLTIAASHCKELFTRRLARTPRCRIPMKVCRERIQVADFRAGLPSERPAHHKFFIAGGEQLIRRRPAHARHHFGVCAEPMEVREADGTHKPRRTETSSRLFFASCETRSLMAVQLAADLLGFEKKSIKSRNGCKRVRNGRSNRACSADRAACVHVCSVLHSLY
jgi:hypothetical protein